MGINFVSNGNQDFVLNFNGDNFVLMGMTRQGLWVTLWVCQSNYLSWCPVWLVVTDSPIDLLSYPDIWMIGCANQRFTKPQYGVYDVSSQSRKDLSFVKNIILEVHYGFQP